MVGAMLLSEHPMATLPAGEVANGGGDDADRPRLMMIALFPPPFALPSTTSSLLDAREEYGQPPLLTLLLNRGVNVERASRNNRFAKEARSPNRPSIIPLPNSSLNCQFPTSREFPPTDLIRTTPKLEVPTTGAFRYNR